MEKKYCKDCLRWYSTKADQCNVYIELNQPLDNNFIKAVGVTKDKFKIKYSSYYHPSINNINNDCEHYLALPKPIRFLTPIFRHFF